MRFRLSLAKELGKTLGELEEMPEWELRLWMAYADWEHKKMNDGQ